MATCDKSIPRTDLFLTHDWGIDERGRENHQRVSIINERLNALGYITWFDEDMMEGEVRQRMVDGIDGTQCVLAFITERYMNKVNGKSGKTNDNAKMEFDYAFDTKTKEKMICIAMDDTMTNPSNWKGVLKMTMGGCLFIHMNGDFEDEPYLKKQLAELEKQLMLKGISKSKGKKICSECNIYAEGKFCSQCGNQLKDVETDPGGVCCLKGCKKHDKDRPPSKAEKTPSSSTTPATQSERPRCAGCREFIFDKDYTRTDGLCWHIEHFRCSHCDTALAGKKYVERERNPYCIECYDNVFAKTCKSCKLKIAPDDKRVSLKDSNWHADPLCYFCATCKRPFGEQRKFIYKYEKLFCSAKCVEGYR